MNRRAFLTALGAFATQQKFRDLSFQRFAVDPATDQSFTVLRSPYLQNVRDNRASVLWSTLESGVGSVQYSSDGINFNAVTAKSQFFPTTVTGMALNYFQYQA